MKSTAAGLTVNKLLDLYLDGLDADDALSDETIDGPRYANDCGRPALGGPWGTTDVTPEVVLSWQRKLATEGGTKRAKADDGTLLPGKALAPNTIRLARSPLSGAFKLAVENGMGCCRSDGRCTSSPTKALSSEALDTEAGQGVPVVDGRGIERGQCGPSCSVRAFGSASLSGCVGRTSTSVIGRCGSSTSLQLLGTIWCHRQGRATNAVRTIDLDDGLVKVLKAHRKLQTGGGARSRALRNPASTCFTKQGGGSYHPQRLSRDPRGVQRGTRVAPSDGPWITAHEGDAHAGRRCSPEGGRRTAGALRSHAVHQSVLARDANDATRCC